MIDQQHLLQHVTALGECGLPEIAPLPEVKVKRAAKPATKSPAPKKAKAEQPKSARRPTLKPLKDEASGAFIRRIILAGGSGMTDKAFAEVVAVAFPAQKTSAKDVAWNRWDLRRKGLLPAAK